MKRIIILSLSLLYFLQNGTAQTIEGTSNRTKLYITKTAGLPSNLVIKKQTFSEPSGNNFLDAEESGTLTLTLANTGKGDALGLQVKISPQTDISNVTIGDVAPIAKLLAGKEQTLEISLSASEYVESKQIKLKIEITEANGFDLDPASVVTFSTKKLVAPDFTLADVGVNDQSGNGKIEPRELVDITARIQNKGGDARSVVATVNVGDNVFLGGDSKNSFSLETMNSGKWKDVQFSVYTNSRATGVPVSIDIIESRRRFNATLSLTLPFNKKQKKPTEFEVPGIEESTIIHDVPSLSVDVELNIPEAKQKNPNAVAIIFGVEQYRNIANATYAKRDAQFFKEYAIKVLGVTDDNNHIYFRTDDEVTRNEFEKLFTENGWLSKRIKPSSDIYIYYSGHGAPDVKEKTPFLLPSDGDVNYPQQTGYSLHKLYEFLSNCNVQSITVFIDACFSGGARENKMLLADARPIGVSVEIPSIHSEKLVVFAASTGEQFSSGYPAKKHGLFSYYLLKGLRGEADADKDKKLTVEEMQSYLVENVTQTAGQLDREQTPTLIGINKQRVLVKY